MSYHEHKQQSPGSVACAVITVSDSRTEADDESGRLIRERLTGAGHTVTDYAIIENDPEVIRNRLAALVARRDVRVIITSGGTGISQRDVTVGTVSPLLDKKLDGFGELFRHLTYQEIGTGSIMTRAAAGVIRGKIILCFPGSLGAATLAMDKIILPELGHLVREVSR